MYHHKMIQVSRAIASEYKQKADLDLARANIIDALNTLITGMVSAVRGADSLKTLKDKRAFITQHLELIQGVQGTINSASELIGDSRLINFRNLLSSFRCLALARTFAEYAEQSAYFLKLKPVTQFKLNCAKVMFAERAETSNKWAEYYKKQAYYFSRLPKSSQPKKARKLAYKQHLAAFTDHATGIYKPWQPLQSDRFPFRSWIYCTRFNHFVDYLNLHAHNHW